MNQRLSADQPSANRANACAMDAAPTVESGAEESAENCSKSSCKDARSTPTSPMVVTIDPGLLEQLRISFEGLWGVMICLCVGALTAMFLSFLSSGFSPFEVLCLLTNTAVITSTACWTKGKINSLNQ